MLLSDNINRLMIESNVSNGDLARYIGDTTNESVRRWRNGSNVPPIDKAQKIAEYFHISLDDLMGKHITTERIISLPLIGAVNAGVFTIESEDDWRDEFRSVSLNALKGRSAKECVLLQVVGDSMIPLVYDGEMVIVHRQNYASNGNIVVAYDENQGGYTLKEYYQKGDTVKLIPANAQYKTYVYNNPNASQLRIWGVCLSAERSLV